MQSSTSIDVVSLDSIHVLDTLTNEIGKASDREGEKKKKKNRKLNKEHQGLSNEVMNVAVCCCY